MKIRFFCIAWMFAFPLFLYSADQAARIRQLNFNASMYVPGGEPAPIMIWVPKATIDRGACISDHIYDALVCFPKVPKTVESAAKKCIFYTEAFFDEDDCVKVAVARDDMQKILDSLKPT